MNPEKLTKYQYYVKPIAEYILKSIFSMYRSCAGRWYCDYCKCDHDCRTVKYERHVEYFFEHYCSLGRDHYEDYSIRSRK